MVKLNKDSWLRFDGKVAIITGAARGKLDKKE